MIVLGVDPGLAATGYGLISFLEGRSKLLEGGVVRSNENDPMEKRVGAIFSGITEILEAFSPDIISMEDLYSHYKHPKTAIIMAHARGAVLAAANEKGIEVVSYPATRIKNSIAANGRAPKEQVRRMILHLLGLERIPEPYDISDALAAALCHINHNMKSVAS